MAQISVSEKVREHLTKLKGRRTAESGQNRTYNDVIAELLNVKEEEKKSEKSAK